MPKFAPFIPMKPLDSIIMHSQSKTSLGIATLDGRASNITVHGLDKVIVRNIEYVYCIFIPQKW